MQRNFLHSITAAIVLAGLVFLNVFGYFNPVLDAGRRGAEFLQIPFVTALGKAKDFFGVVFSLNDLAKQNGLLSQQVQELTAQLAVLEKTSQENRILRDALGFTTETQFKIIPAEVIAYDALNQEQKITLNRGRAQGISESSAVVTSGNVLVGMISQVSDQTSQMSLITSSSMTINAQTSAGTATGVVKGEHGMGLLFDLVSQTDTIASGDKIITSGLGGLFPKNLYIGKVGEIKSGPSELFQQANVLPAADLKNLRFVFVIKNQ